MFCLSNDTEASCTGEKLEEVEVAPAVIPTQGIAGKRPWKKDVALDSDVQPICLLSDHLYDEIIATKAVAADREHKRRWRAVESQWKFRDIWAAKLPWAKLHGEPDDPNA